MIPFGLAVAAGVASAWYLERLRRQGQRALMMLTSAGVVLALVALGVAAWRWQPGRLAYVTLVLSLVVATLLHRRHDDPAEPPAPAA